MGRNEGEEDEGGVEYSDVLKGLVELGLHLKNKVVSSDWYSSVGCWFDSPSEHMPGLQARSLSGGMPEATDPMFLTLMVLSLSPSFPLSLKINKILKNKGSQSCSSSILTFELRSIGDLRFIGDVPELLWQENFR